MVDGEKLKTHLIRENEELRRRLAEMESERLQLLNRAIEASANGVVIADAQTHDMPLIYVNPAFETMTGYVASECLGRNCRFLHQGDREQAGLDTVRQILAGQQDGRAVLRNYRKDGTLFWNELYLSPVRNSENRLTHYIGIQNEITKQVRLEESKDMFLRIASHDLKSPLAAILTAAEVLCKIAPEGTAISHDVFRVFENIVSRGKEMKTIIEDYLDFMAIEDGQISVSCDSFDLCEAIRAVVESNQPYAESKSIALMCHPQDGELPVSADQRKIGQVAHNLIGNAIKYGSTGDHVDVRIFAGDGVARVEVTDSGPGLSPEDLEKVFGRYARLSNKPTAGEKSSGLGLYICKKLIDLHSGGIGVFNNEDKGATFWFELKCE